MSDPSPLQEAEATCHQLAGVVFPWDLTRSLELALLKTFCVPSISALLDRTGEFAQRPRKRYDDTGLMVAELLRHGVDSEAGAAVIERMNHIHGHYAIGNDDFLYVLSTFVAEPIRWLSRYGWRGLNDLEQEHLFRFWQAVGQRMGISAIPGSLVELMALNEQVEREVFALAPSNRRVADATLAMLLADWPAPTAGAATGADRPARSPDGGQPGLARGAGLAAAAGARHPAPAQPRLRRRCRLEPRAGAATPGAVLLPAAHPQLWRQLPA
ncbi:oxygenase MpaB family protein [Cyanobium sp. ATX-6F1]|uniref:oxygenase MpaB family protein n=1 Tax=Cyanobium sp. ATX-6F1 TaxID=3137388 RepID=UPI0039BE9487